MSSPHHHGRAARYAAWVVRFRVPVLLLSLAMIIALGYGARNIIMNDSYRYFFKPGNPQLAAFDELQNTYNKNDNILFVLEPSNGDVFTPKTLEAIEFLTEEAWQIPFSIRVDSISNFQYTYAEEDDLIVEDLVEGGASFSPEKRQKVRDIALKEPLIVDRLLSKDGKVTGVNVTLQLPGEKVGEQVPAVSYAREMAKTMEQRYPEIKIHLTGFVMLNNAFQEASMADMTSLMPIMFLILIFAMAFLLRSVGATVTTLMVVFLSVLGTMGTIGLLGINMSPPTGITPTLIMTLAVADSIHILVSVLQNMRNGMVKKDAIIEGLRLNIQPVFLTSLTTMIGFLSLNFSDVQPLNDLGNMVAIGVTFAFVLSVTFLPAFAAIIPIKVKAVANNEDSMTRFADFVIEKRKPLLWASTGIILFLALQIPNNELNDEFVKYFDPSIQFRQDTDFTTEHLTGIYQIEMSLDSGESGGIAEPKYLERLEAFAQWFRSQDDVLHVDTLSDTLKRLNKNMHGDDPTYYQLPESRELAAQYLLLYEMSLPFGLDLNNRINVDKSASRFVVTLNDVSTARMRELSEAGEAWVSTHAPELQETKGSGPPVMFAYLSIRNSISMFFGTLLAFLLITGTLIIALKDLKLGLLSLIPNLAPSIMAFGVWAVIDGTINFGLTVVSALSIGIVVDDTVHFISKYLRARREKGMSAENAIRYTFNTVGRAMTVTTLVLIFGFTVMMFSTFDMNEGMGKLTAMTLGIALIADFLMLPALLLMLDRKPVEEDLTDAILPELA